MRWYTVTVALIGISYFVGQVAEHSGATTSTERWVIQSAIFIAVIIDQILRERSNTARKRT